MFQVLVLICALNVAPSDCQSHNALDVINGPVVANEVMCGLHGQAQMAPTSMMKRDGSEYMKLQCLRLPQTDAGLRGLDEAVAARLANRPVRQ